MEKIYKYHIEVTDEQQVSLPKGAQILTVQTQQEQPCIWVLVDPQMPTELVTIRVHGTGHDVPDSDNLKYIGTFQMMGGGLVFHTFRMK